MKENVEAEESKTAEENVTTAENNSEEEEIVYYRPVLKDSDHLVPSKKNPKTRVRGLSRDENNKNQDIPEWDIVKAEDIHPPKSREELEFELKKFEAEERVAAEKAKSDERLARYQKSIETLDTINSSLETINAFLEFFQDHPEIVIAISEGSRKAFNVVKSWAHRAFIGINSVIHGSNKSKAEVIKYEKENQKETINALLGPDTSIFPNVPIDEEDSRVDMSIDKARSLVIKILLKYISMRKDIEELKNAKILNLDNPQLDMNQVLAIMDSLIETYPALLDDKTYYSILDILNNNAEYFDREKVLDVLRIDQIEKLGEEFEEIQ